MIDLSLAAELIDFGTKIASDRAREQLEGAVAIHNLLRKNKVAYLADEVGMGKTYVALGVWALFRHFDPGFRTLVIAPRENIQRKWVKERRVFVDSNIRFPDMRVKAVDGRPAAPAVICSNLIELVRESVLDPDRDFFLRLTSFSLPVEGRKAVDTGAATRYRDELRAWLPWLRPEVFDLRDKRRFKDHVARAICCALPVFDLVIVDEAHNLKHGFTDRSAARNRVLALAFGREAARDEQHLFPGYGPRAKHVLFLSATPIEESYAHLWSQLDVFGRGDGYQDLRGDEVADERKKHLASELVVRRVRSIRLEREHLTKNQYRREWRRGGVSVHDEPVRIDDPRQRLVVALVQKKVMELLGHERFNSSFQIGMLASFESFLETARAKDADDSGNFDDADQTEDRDEREGIDVLDVNRLARSYRQAFGAEMPHPKMDTVVGSLKESWRRGEKSLVFVRRVASVRDLKRKLDECYDGWLIDRLRRELPASVQDRLERVVAQYLHARCEARDEEDRRSLPEGGEARREPDNPGGSDTFFAWFFRGEGPRGVVSGANIQQRFNQRGATYATFFEDNYVADLLGCAPEDVEERLAGVLGVGRPELREGLRARSRFFLRRTKKHARADRFEAVQAAAVEWLKEHAGPNQAPARVVWHERFESSRRWPYASEAPDVGNWLSARTFFTELRLRPALRAQLWPEPRTRDLRDAFRERELRAQLLAGAARLGHAFIDLYVLTIQRIGSLDQRAQEEADDGSIDLEVARIQAYLDFLESQSRVPLRERTWGAFDELADYAANFDLILRVNLDEARSKPLSESAKEFGRLLREQQPVGGMSGQVNSTLVKQFRLPGYPLVLVTTDLLQEGEDLHTFCSAVHHYGVSWTPSAMEQRTGRIDRVDSHTERRLTSIGRAASEDEKLQVYFPHLEDTVEVLQVQRVLERMNVFLRLMHEGLTTEGPEDRKIDTRREFLRGIRPVPQIRERLRTAFPVADALLRGTQARLAVRPDLAESMRDRFRALLDRPVPGLDVVWDPPTGDGQLLGSVRLGQRQQPFILRLQSLESFPLVRCTSPVGIVFTDGDGFRVDGEAARGGPGRPRVALVDEVENEHYDMTVEDDVLLGPDPVHDRARVAMLVGRVVSYADALEQECLEGADAELEHLREALAAEGADDR